MTEKRQKSNKYEPKLNMDFLYGNKIVSALPYDKFSFGLNHRTAMGFCSKSKSEHRFFSIHVHK